MKPFALTIILCGMFFSTNLVFADSAERSVIDSEILKRRVETLVTDFGPRDSEHPTNLRKVAEYIREEFKKLKRQPSEQLFVADGREFSNILVELGPETEEVIVVGAHYDTAGPMPGADDNASGVAGLLELGRYLAKHPPKLKTILAAYCLEEPPYFRTSLMGSAIHAAEMRTKKSKIRLMLSLEMIGYFSDKADSQRYPIPALDRVYPKVGNFIGVVGTTEHVHLTNTVKAAMQDATPLPVYSINAPRLLPGIDFSDHLNFLNAGYPGIMITDTADYRNEAYHTPDDTPDRLDYKRMALVVEGVAAAIHKVASAKIEKSPN